MHILINVGREYCVSSFSTCQQEEKLQQQKNPTCEIHRLCTFCGEECPAYMYMYDTSTHMYIYTTHTYTHTNTYMWCIQRPSKTILHLIIRLMSQQRCSQLHQWLPRLGNQAISPPPLPKSLSSQWKCPIQIWQPRLPFHPCPNISELKYGNPWLG